MAQTMHLQRPLKASSVRTLREVLVNQRQLLEGHAQLQHKPLTIMPDPHGVKFELGEKFVLMKRTAQPGLFELHAYQKVHGLKAWLGCTQPVGRFISCAESRAETIGRILGIPIHTP